MFRTFLWALTLAVAGCAQQSGSGGAASEYAVDIRWTSFGIPHVQAADWPSLGYGFAYATAEDAVCVIARDVVMVNSRNARHFGPSAKHRASDLFHAAILTDERLARYEAAQSDKARAFARGYVAGYNRYLKDHENDLPASCAAAPWVRPIDAADLARINVGFAVRYGLGRFQEGMAAASAPGASVAAVSPDMDRNAGLGSNAIAFGRDATRSGRGLLFGNPHYPWRGSSRFHLMHMTLPGELDVMGTSLYGTSRIGIGFNKDIAWSHTVSTAQRFTLYRLDLHPETPTRYRYGNGWRDMSASTVAMNGETRDVYFSHYGPVIVMRGLPWDDKHAYAIRDAALENALSARTYDALGVAASIDDVEAAISEQGVPWTNTIAADRHGGAFYADISATPNIDQALIDACRVEVEGLPPWMIALDGADPDCEWKNDARSKVAGAMPAADMPRLRRDDFVTNSNDSYWLSNHKAPLEGYSPVIGPERTARSLRTRAGLTFIEEVLADGAKVGPDEVEAMLDSHRNFGAELLLDDVLALCDAADEPDIQAPCAALRGWDRRQANDSRGAQVWTEFWSRAREIEGLYAVPFDAAEPLATPSGLAIGNAEVAGQLKQHLAEAAARLSEAGIPLTARWGDIQYAERNGEHIPIPGGQGWAGMWSMIVADLKDQAGYTPIVHGNSYMQIIYWDADGNLRPRAMLTYSQSQEADSPHYADLTRLYSRGEWIELPFSDEEIERDPNLRRLRLTE